LRFWQPISLAHFRYARIHKDHGGPIARLSVRESQRLGEKVFEAFALLDEKAGLPDTDTSNLYGNWHGSGTAPGRAEAVYRALSEALERWAWSQASSREELGFQLDSSTTGFAAFPGIHSRSPRAAAYLEAAERWSLDAWWEERLGQRLLQGLPWEGVRGIQILSPLRGTFVVILWKDCEHFRAYGFAGGVTVPAAAQKAAVELGRNIQVLDYQRSVAGTPQGEPSSRNERRLLFFAGKKGRELFDRRVARTVNGLSAAPDLAVDGAVPGPWTRYAHVWRCLFDPRGLTRDSLADDYFHF
jgi:hypothetical protein